MLLGAPHHDSLHCLYQTPREHANPLQFLVGEVRLFLVAGAFYVAHSRFLRDSVKLSFCHAEQAAGSCLREKSWDLIVHNLPLSRRARLGVSGSSVVVVISGLRPHGRCAPRYASPTGRLNTTKSFGRRSRRRLLISRDRGQGAVLRDFTEPELGDSPDGNDFATDYVARCGVILPA